jgi:hypothetical protein
MRARVACKNAIPGNRIETRRRYGRGAVDPEPIRAQGIDRDQDQVPRNRRGSMRPVGAPAAETGQDQTRGETEITHQVVSVVASLRIIVDAP